REQPVAELVDLALVLRTGKLAAFADDDDREVLAARVASPDLGADLVEVDRLLRDQDHVGAARDAAHHGDPAGVPTHHLDHHHAVVRLGRRVQAVDRLPADVHRRVQAEGVVGPGEVVVDRLRHPDHRSADVGVQARRDAEGVLASDRDERVELLERAAYPLDTAVDLVGIGPGRPDDRAAAGQDPRDLARPERLEELVDHASPPFAHTDPLVAALPRAPHHGADDRVQAGAITAAGEDADAHGRRVYVWNAYVNPTDSCVEYSPFGFAYA